MEYNADADAENGHGDERPAPAPGDGNAGGDERCQEIAEAAADHVKAERLAAFSWLYHGRYHGGGGGMITAPQYAHQHQASEQYKIVGRQTDQQPGGAHADDTGGEQDAGSEAVGEPSRRQLADAVDYTESRYDESGAGVIQGEFVADIGQERHRQGSNQVMGKMRQHEQGHQSTKKRAQIESASDGGFLSAKEALWQVISVYVS